MARIGIVIYSLAGAGAERVSVNLAREFVAIGHSVDFILVERAGEFVEEASAVAQLYSSSQIGASEWRKCIRKYICDKSPDVILAMMEGAGVVSIQAAKGLSVPVFVVSHIHFSKHCRTSRRWKERWLMPLAARWYFPKAAAVIGVSEGVTKDIMSSAGLDAEKVHTIYNPILTDSFYSNLAEPVDHPWLSENRDWLTIVTVGRLTDQKDHETLLRAVAVLGLKNKFRLIIFGQGELRSRLEILANQLGVSECVEFAGFNSNPYPYIAAADVFALSSQWEGFGNVLVEALACGVSVVSTDCPSGPREVLADGEFGSLVPVGNCLKMASAIIEKSNKATNKEALASHLNKFKTSNVAKDYLDFMNVKI